MSGPLQSASLPPPSKEARGGKHVLGDVWRWLGIGGDALGTGGVRRRTFFIAYGATAILVAAINAINVITIAHDRPQDGILGPLIWEGSSWVALMLFFWIPWLAYRLAPPAVRPRWKLLLHVPAAMAFSLAHVGGFVGLRMLIYRLAGAHYDFGAFWPHYFYELRKDGLGYGLFVAGFALIEHLLRQQQLVEAPGQTLTFDIRDGAKLTRVKLDEVLAIASAGNYVEFVLADGRRLLMRSPLSALEGELAARGFLRTHRSWLVNAGQLTGLSPAGSGDYTVCLGTLEVPLSRRYPQALAKLKEG